MRLCSPGRALSSFAFILRQALCNPSTTPFFASILASSASTISGGALLLSKERECVVSPRLAPWCSPICIKACWNLGTLCTLVTCRTAHVKADLKWCVHECLRAIAWNSANACTGDSTGILGYPWTPLGHTRTLSVVQGCTT